MKKIVIFLFTFTSYPLFCQTLPTLISPINGDETTTSPTLTGNLNAPTSVGYKIYYSRYNNFTPTNYIAGYGIGTVSTALSNLELGDWYWKISYDYNGNTYSSSVGNFVVTSKEAPVLVNPSNNVSIELPYTFTWTHNDPNNLINFYQLRFKDAGSASTTDKSKTITEDMLDAGTYTWYVNAWYNDGSYYKSSERTITIIGNNTPPEDVTLLSPPDGSEHYNIFNLSWECTDQDGDELLYYITGAPSVNDLEEPSGPTGYGWESRTSLEVDPNEFEESEKNIPIYWKVYASDGQDISESDIWTFIIINENVLGNPLLVSPTNNSILTVPFELQWQQGENATQSRVHIKENNGTEEVWDWSTEEFVNVTSLQVGTYDWYVESTDGTNYTTSDTWTFTLEEESNGGLDCQNAITLTSGVTYNGNTDNGTSNVSNYSCESWNESGKEVVHKITATHDGTATIQYSENVDGYIDLFLLGSCDTLDCINAWDGGANVNVSFEATAGITYYLVTDVYQGGLGGAYSLKVTMPNSNPVVADFTATPVSGCSPLEVVFTNQSTDATSWSWNFGDGGTSTIQNPVYTYNDIGTYTVELTATNQYGNDIKTKTDYVIVESCPLPVANFTATPTSGTVPLTVQFTDESEEATSWSWDFGDGNSSTQKDPSYTYSNVGTYTVTLTVTNDYGDDTEIKTDYINVDNTTGIKNPDNLYSINIFPNPTKGSLYFETEMNLSQIEIYNMLGGLVYESKFKQEINIENLNEGVYLLKLYKDDHTVITQKVFLNK